MTAHFSDAPDWSQLPHNPAAFFQLPNDFDRKALKRKYNQLIRKYKPEKAPAEFQKIRAAYEFLDSQLRYGSTPDTFSNPSYNWSTAAEQQAKPSSPKPSRPAKQDQRTADANAEPVVAEVVEFEVPLYQRIENESPVAVYKELLNKSEKTPFDFFSLALLSDVVSDDPMMFFKLLLTGLQKHPQESGLINLLYAFLQQDFEAKQIPAILNTLSTIVTDQYFYFLTEKLWEQLLRRSKFALFAKTLSDCEANLKDYRIEGQLAFYLHILPIAMFKGDGRWVQSKYNFVDSNASELPTSLEMDFELVYQLFEYRKSLIGDDPYSAELHRAIAHYFLLGGQDGDEAVISLQAHFAHNPSLLLNRYGPDTPFNNQQLVVWDYVNEDICQRSDLFSPVDPRQLRSKIFDLMDDLNRSEYAAFGAGEQLRYHSMKYLPYGVAMVVPFILLSPWMANSVVTLCTIVLALAAVFAVYFWYRPSDRYDRYLEKRMQRRYYGDWRSRFVHLFEATQIHHAELTNAMLEIIETHSEKVGFAAWLCRFLPGDVGLHLFAIATRYLK